MSVDLKLIYPDPYGPGGYESGMDIAVRQGAFGQELGRAIGELRKAAQHLNAYVGRRELADPYWRQMRAGLLDARLQATQAVDGLLADLGERDG